MNMITSGVGPKCHVLDRELAASQKEPLIQAIMSLGVEFATGVGEKGEIE